eukprot:2369410-Rhodomonas_salina.1
MVVVIKQLLYFMGEESNKTGNRNPTHLFHTPVAAKRGGSDLASPLRRVEIGGLALFVQGGKGQGSSVKVLGLSEVDHVGERVRADWERQVQEGGRAHRARCGVRASILCDALPRIGACD